MGDFLHAAGCEHVGEHSDAAKRASDQVNLHISALGRVAAHRIVALALADGSSDGTLYDSQAAAVTHQHNNEQRYCFVKIPPGGMPVCEAESVLRFWRKAAAAGFRTDPGGPAPIPRLTRADHVRQLLALTPRKVAR